MSSFLAVLGLTSLFVGLISIIKPMNFLRIRTRRAALLPLFFGLVLSSIAGQIIQNEEAEEARLAGFSSAIDYTEAKRLNLATPDALMQYRVEQEIAQKDASALAEPAAAEKAGFSSLDEYRTALAAGFNSKASYDAHVRNKNAVGSPAFDFSADGIKALSPEIQKVSLTAQITNKGKSNTYLVDIEVSRNPFTGGAQDWNSIASDVFRLSKRLFAQPEAVRINFTFRSPSNNNTDWAHVFVTLDKLPQGWSDITYLEFFSFVRPLAGTLEVEQWLCDFYRMYESAVPQGKLPPSCNLKD